MTSKRRLKELRGSAAERALEACFEAMKTSTLSMTHIRNAMRCEPCAYMMNFEMFLKHVDLMVRGAAASLVAKVDPGRVVEEVMEARNLAELNPMLTSLEEAKFRDLEDLTPLLKIDDEMMVERVLQAFVTVGRADLLFGLAVSGDDKTTKRIKRYLHEQGFLK